MFEMETGWLAFTDAYFVYLKKNVTMKTKNYNVHSSSFKLSLCYLLSQFRDCVCTVFVYM